MKKSVLKLIGLILEIIGLLAVLFFLLRGFF